MQPARIILISIIVHQLFVSCDNGEKASLVTGAPAGNLSTPVSEAAPLPAQQLVSGTGSNVVTLNPKHGEPGHRCDIAVGAPLNSASGIQPVSQPVSASATPAIGTGSNALLSLPNLPVNGGSAPTNGNVALNPKHGEPGHRCDIQVGAPLNSAPATAAVQSAASSPAAVIPALNQTAGGNVKLNPKHGEPGHRCDIQVGAPLNSKPNTVSQPAPTVSSTAPIGAAAIPALQLPNTGASTGGKVNPKHGEPGHRCDIAVGAPLN
jgi:hypothetical protein